MSSKKFQNAPGVRSTLDATDEELAASKPQPTDTDIRGLRELGQELASIDAAFAAMGAVTEVMGARRRELVEKVIPDRMMELQIPFVGLPSVTQAQWLADASKTLLAAASALTNPTPELLLAIKVPGDVMLRVDDFCRANIATSWEAPRREAAFKWLDDNGHGGVIKVEVSAMFARGQKVLADKAVKAFRKALGSKADDVPVDVKETVPHGTLSALVRAEIEAGHPVPLETLGATVGKVAKLAKAKK